MCVHDDDQPRRVKGFEREKSFGGKSFVAKSAEKENDPAQKRMRS